MPKVSDDTVEKGCNGGEGYNWVEGYSWGEGYNCGEAFKAHPWGELTRVLAGEQVLWSMATCKEAVDDDSVDSIPQVNVGDDGEATNSWGGAPHDLMDMSLNEFVIAKNWSKK